MSEELKGKVLQYMRDKAKVKTRLSIKDIVAGLPDEDKKEVKLAVQAMTTEGSLKYWSSGSSTYLMLPEYFPKENE